MYFFYIDESGSRDPTVVMSKDGAAVAKDHIYCLTAVALFEGRWRRFDREISLLKLELIDHLQRSQRLKLDLADCEVKSGALRMAGDQDPRKSTPFLRALCAADRERLAACFFHQLGNHNMTVFAVVVDKRKLRDHMTHETLHKKAYELLLERIHHFMREFHPKHHALIVMDDTSRELNRAVAMKHAFFQREGNQNMRFGQIVEYPFFTDSRLSTGIQLADLCSYNIYRAFKTQDFGYPYFRYLLPYFYRREKVEKLDGLKVFPDDSELVEWSRAGWAAYQKEGPAADGGAEI